jgi:GntR family transcriptional repressor for pyruvate dehydrogenase complex
LPTEQEFAEQLNVGRNSVREAIKMLASLGIVEIRRGIGTFIASSLHDSAINPLILSLVFESGTNEELAEPRYLFEIGLAELVVQKVTPEDIERLVEANETLGKVLREDPTNYDLITDLNIDFHRQIIRITRNKYIERMGIAVYTLYRTSSEQVFRKEKFIEIEYDFHNRLIELIKQGDARGIVSSIRQGMDWLIDIINGVNSDFPFSAEQENTNIP